MAKQFSGKVSIVRARMIYVALGFKTAGDWDAFKLQKKLEKLDTLVEGAELDKKNLKKVNEILRYQAKGRKVIVVVVDDIAADKKRDQSVKDAAKRETKRKAEKKVKSAKKEKATAKKTAGKAKAKGQAKKVVVAKEKTPGLMMSMYEFIKNEEPISAKKILSLLKKRFPERNPESIERCIPRYPKCLADSRGITDIGQDDKERYIIVKKSKK